MKDNTGMKSNKLLIPGDEHHPVVTYCSTDKRPCYINSGPVEMLKFHPLESSLEECIASATESIRRMSLEDLTLSVLGYFDSLGCKNSDTEDMDVTSPGTAEGTCSDFLTTSGVGLLEWSKPSAPQEVNIWDIHSDLLHSGTAVYLGKYYISI